MTLSEENYLKIIYHLSANTTNGVSTNAIAKIIDAKPSSVTDMIQKLSEKKYINYIKYQGVSLTDIGNKIAIDIIRKHRLWELFLVEKLGFSWDEVHDVAEQLEHIQSEKLIEKLNEFLGFPTHDPHGDPIPDKNGNFINTSKLLLSDINKNQKGICVGVKDSSKAFLQYLDKVNISLGTTITLIEKNDFDESFEIKVNEMPLHVSLKIASNLYIKIIE